MANWRPSIYERDNWQCRMPVCLCPDGRDINPRLRGTASPWAPSLDHSVRKSEGGSNKRDNLRAAHRWCNQADAGVPPEQPKPAPPRRALHLTYCIGDLFPGDQGSAWS
jgi:hypothetical protein